MPFGNIDEIEDWYIDGAVWDQSSHTYRFGPLQIDVDVNTASLDVQVTLLLMSVRIGDADLSPADVKAQIGGSFAGSTAMIDIDFDVENRTLSFTAIVKLPTGLRRTWVWKHVF